MLHVLFRLGPKAFEQCAGFLRLRGDNPLDASAVHPESYPVVERIAAATGLGVAELIGNTRVLAGLRPRDFADERFGVPTVTDIIIRATHTQEVLGEQGRRIRELTSLIQKRFKFPENSVSLYAAKVQNRGLSAVAQCESLRYKLLNGLAVRRACYGVLRFIMESGAKGCEVVVSGKLRAARAKSMKFTVRAPAQSQPEVLLTLFRTDS